MSSPLGKVDESKPQTDYDKRMSKVHKAHRKMVDKMKDSPEKFEKSIFYNRQHMVQHQKALVKSKEQLKAMKKEMKMRKG